MEYWKLRDEKDKAYLVVYGSRMSYGLENKTRVFAEYNSFDSLEKAYNFANKHEFSEVLEWFKDDFMVKEFVKEYYTKKWNNQECVFLFKDFLKNEYQFFTDIYTLMFLVAKYSLVVKQFNFISDNHNYYLKHVFNPVFYDRLCTQQGYKRIGYVDFEKGIYR